ncbi:MAG: TlpA family protein disulfide reductase [Candidatus Halalkalibacterium sp. M3_1C_030]
MHIKYSFKPLLLFACILLFSCTKTNTTQVSINTDLTEYGLDSLEIETLTPARIDSVANLIHENIKQDYLRFKDSSSKNGKSDLRNEEYFGDKLYGYYLHFPDSDNSVENLRRAFAIWLVAGAVDKMEVALNRISINKDYWGDLVSYYNISKTSARERSWLSFIDRQDQENHIQKLVEWNNEAGNNVTRTHLSFYIARTYFYQQEYEKADDHLLTVLELNRDSVLTGCQTIVDNARAYFNEIHSLQVGDKAPIFSASSISGELIALSQFNGKVVLLEFWSTTCGPCIEELPNLKNLYASLKNKDDFVMLGVSLDTDIERVRGFVNKQNMEWKQIFDNGYGNISKRYNAAFIPRTYLINKNGNIAYKDLRGEDLKNAVGSMLE